MNTTSPQEKPRRLWRYIITILVVILAIGILFFQGTIISAYHSVADRSSLPHYLSAHTVTQQVFDTVISESRTVNNSQVSSIPVLAYFFAGEKPKTIYGEEIIADDPGSKYYLLDTLEFKLDTLVLKVLPMEAQSQTDPAYIVSGLKSNEGGGPPYDPRWAPTGGFACFSCGCSCYMQKQLKVADGKFYVNVSGESYAIKPENQGLYFFNTQHGGWIRLTPKIDGNFKIANSGCDVYYTVASQPYILNVCTTAINN